MEHPFTQPFAHANESGRRAVVAPASLLCVCGKTVKVTDRIWSYNGKSCHLTRFSYKTVKASDPPKKLPPPYERRAMAAQCTIEYPDLI